MATGSPFTPRTQFASHWTSCGQTLPQTGQGIIFRITLLCNAGGEGGDEPGIETSPGTLDTFAVFALQAPPPDRLGFSEPLVDLGEVAAGAQPPSGHAHPFDRHVL
jgi:hypothetical protein